MADADFIGRVAEFAAKGNWNQLIREVEETQMYSSQGQHTAPGCCACAILAYLINDDVHNARFAYRRLPPPTQKEPSVTAAWDVAKALCKRDLPAAHAVLAGTQWEGPCVPAAAALQDALRLRAAKLLGAAYSNIQVSRAAQLMGCDAAAVLQIAGQLNWPHDPATGTLSARERKEKGVGEVTTGLRAIRGVTSTALFLEQLGSCSTLIAEEEAAKEKDKGGTK